jgi:DNA polymerase-3 subunit epsilon
MRQIVLDTETTGLSPKEGHRIIEIACVELFDRRLTGNHYQVYINPERPVDQGAFKIHGISDDFLKDKPRFSDIVPEFLDYVKDSELVIHNAPFDIRFLNHELQLYNKSMTLMDKRCDVIDTLVLAKKKHPGKKNNLDALCRRYDIDNSTRELHGALLDSELLALVYLAMTGGQSELFIEDATKKLTETKFNIQNAVKRESPLPKVLVSPEEEKAHSDYLSFLDKKSKNKTVWKTLEKIEE